MPVFWMYTHRISGNVCTWKVGSLQVDSTVQTNVHVRITIYLAAKMQITRFVKKTYRFNSLQDNSETSLSPSATSTQPQIMTTIITLQILVQSADNAHLSLQLPMEGELVAKTLNQKLADSLLVGVLRVKWVSSKDVAMEKSGN